jgi:hypothetical protein
MSTDLGSAFKKIPGYEDPKGIDLVEKIAEKTRQGKIVWEKTTSSVVATAPGMQLSFVRSFSPLAGEFGGWEIFSVRSQQGTEILKVEQTSGLPYFGVPASAPPPPRNQLSEAVDSLYSTASSRGPGDIDKALQVIRQPIAS